MEPGCPPVVLPVQAGGYPGFVIFRIFLHFTANCQADRKFLHP